MGHDFVHDADVDRDFGNAIIGPGFIDLVALADIDHSLLDTWSDPEHAKGFQWSAQYASGSRHVFSADERLFIREFALRQLLINGVTTAMPIAAETHSEWAESFDDLVGVADIAERIGIRIYLGPSFRDGVNGVNVVTGTGERDIHWDTGRGRVGFEDAIRFVEEMRTRNSPFVDGCLLPCRIETQTLETLRAVAEAASELQCLVRIHGLQSEDELRALRTHYDSSPLELLDSATWMPA